MSRLVLVTGGSRGIGAAIAKRLAKDGWTPLVHYRERKADAEAVALESGGIAAPFGADLSSRDDCERIWDWAMSVGTISALVNNAGIYKPMAFDVESDEEFENTWRLHYEANFLSTLRLTRYFVKSAARGARILNVCSRVGYRGEACAAAYAASKAAQINLTRSLAVELAPKGIGVFGIAPGWVETAMTRPGMETRRSEIEAGIPLGRVATPEDCAAAVAFLLSDEAMYLSGVVLDVNGASYFH